MRVHLSTLALALPLAGTALADRLHIQRHQNNDCFYTCAGTLQVVPYGDVPAEATTYYAKMAESNSFMTSLAACIDVYCKSSSVQYRGALKGWEEYIGYALEYGPDVIMPTYEEVEARMPPASEIKQVEVYALTVNDTINGTITPVQADYDLYMRTLVRVSSQRLADG